jgi:pentafunctional AROM polypeptide
LGVFTNPPDYLIEADASSATYPLAFAAATGASVTVLNIGAKSMQGDSAFATSVLEKMGCAVSQTDTTTTVTGPAGPLLPLEKIDMETMTDAFLTATTLAALAPGRTEIFGIANQHVKECDRIHAQVSQLEKFGVRGEELADGIVVHGPDSQSDIKAVGGGDEESVYCFDDHRVAMSFSILACGLKKPTLVLERRCVEKTWPGLFKIG